MDYLTFSALDQHCAGWLERSFEEEEVHKVIRSMASNKAPSPDGFTMDFFQVCREVITGDLMPVFQDFHTHARFERSLNATFLALIYKKTRSVCVRDYRPNSTVNEVYKILSKVLANRLSTVMEKLLLKPQNAFFKSK